MFNDNFIFNKDSKGNIISGGYSISSLINENQSQKGGSKYDKKDNTFHFKDIIIPSGLYSYHNYYKLPLLYNNKDIEDTYQEEDENIDFKSVSSDEDKTYNNIIPNDLYDKILYSINTGKNDNTTYGEKVSRRENIRNTRKKGIKKSYKTKKTYKYHNHKNKK